MTPPRLATSCGRYRPRSGRCRAGCTSSFKVRGVRRDRFVKRAPRRSGTETTAAGTNPGWPNRSGRLRPAHRVNRRSVKANRLHAGREAAAAIRITTLNPSPAPKRKRFDVSPTSLRVDEATTMPGRRADQHARPDGERFRRKPANLFRRDHEKKERRSPDQRHDRVDFEIRHLARSVSVSSFTEPPLPSASWRSWQGSPRRSEFRAPQASLKNHDHRVRRTKSLQPL